MGLLPDYSTITNTTQSDVSQINTPFSALYSLLGTASNAPTFSDANIATGAAINPAKISGTAATLGAANTFTSASNTFVLGATSISAVGTLNVNTTAVGNVGAGPDDLIIYTLPANTLVATPRGLRITAYGTTANTGNAKTVSLRWGSQTLHSQSLTVSIAGRWEIVGYVLRTGANTQDGNTRIVQGPTALVGGSTLAGTQTETGTITIKCVADTVTADNDIVQELLMVEAI